MDRTELLTKMWGDEVMAASLPLPEGRCRGEGGGGDESAGPSSSGVPELRVTTLRCGGHATVRAAVSTVSARARPVRPDLIGTGRVDAETGRVV